MEQLTSFSSNPDPKSRTPEAKMNDQESIKTRRTHIDGQEIPWSIVRREMTCARTVRPMKWMVALRTRIPTLGNIDTLGLSITVPTPRAQRERYREGKVGEIFTPGLTFCKLTAGTVRCGYIPRSHAALVRSEWFEGLNELEGCRLRRQ